VITDLLEDNKNVLANHVLVLQYKVHGLALKLKLEVILGVLIESLLLEYRIQYLTNTPQALEVPYFLE